MRNLFIVALISVIGFSACTTPFKKAKDGTEYKVIANKDGKKVATGNFIEMNVVAKYGDSTLYNSIDEGMPTFAPYDTAQFPPLYKEVFASVHVGDSVIIRIASDSLIAKGQQAPFMTKGKFLTQTYKIVNLYTSKEQADSAQKTHVAVAKERANKKQMAIIEKNLADNKDQIAKDSKIIEDYLAKNNIKATKTKWGTYVAIQTEGTGNNLTANDVATVNYTGKTLDSAKVFDSNVDPKFGHVQPYQVSVGQYSNIIAGWPDALQQLKKGSKATIYLPSTLAYGKTGNQGIKPDQILVFDMEVTDAQTEEAAMKKAQEEQAAIQQKMAEAQQQAADSTNKALKDQKK